MQDQTIEHQPSCEDELNIGLLTVAQAQARILDGVTPVTDAETVPVREALGRVLAEDIISPIDVPSHTNSAMDGYAVRADDLPAEGVREFTVPGTSWAGRPWPDQDEPGQAVQIMTGGMMQAGAETVVMKEDSTLSVLGKKDFDELISNPLIKTVNQKVAKSLLDTGYIPIDVRYPEEYDDSHIPGAISIYDAQFDKNLDKLPKDPWGEPYRFLNPGQNGEIDIFTLGADNQPGGEGVDADIGNWDLN